MSRWKIFYADGSTFDSRQGEPVDAPNQTVAVIVVEDGIHNKRILKGADWFRWDDRDGRWYDCDAFSVLLVLADRGSIVARRGEYLPELKYQDILIAAYNDRFIEPVSPESVHPAWRA